MPRRDHGPARRHNWIICPPGEHRPCWVWADGQWWPGWLRDWIRRDDDQTPLGDSTALWWGTVNWRGADGLQRHQALPSDRLARREDGSGPPAPVESAA